MFSVQVFYVDVPLRCSVKVFYEGVLLRCSVKVFNEGVLCRCFSVQCYLAICAAVGGKRQMGHDVGSLPDCFKIT